MAPETGIPGRGQASRDRRPRVSTGELFTGGNGNQMKRIALPVLAAALAGLTACTSGTAPAAPAASTAAASPATPAAATPAATHPVSAAQCRQQYGTWQQGPGKGLIATLGTIGAAGAAGDTGALRVALRNAGPALTRAASHPLPACADPKGYWTVLLMHVSAAAGTKSAAALTMAMNGVPVLIRELTAELQHAGS